MGKNLSSTINLVGLSVFIIGFTGFELPAQAWDRHHYITAKALKPIQALLPATVPIHSIEQFLETAFPGCDEKTFFEKVVQGVGPEYQVFYADQVNYNLEWQGDLYSVETLLSPVSSFFGAPEIDPASVIATYSDEPDWLMDVDVPSYKLKKLKIQGTGSNIFRHFWFDKSSPVDFELDTPQHTERIFKLAMAAFAAGESYWGYRFLGQATHYIQDVTQPFHTQAIPSYAMVRRLEVLNAIVDSYMRWSNNQRAKIGLPPLYKLKKTEILPFDKAVLLSGMAVTTYHSIFEGFARTLTRMGSLPEIPSPTTAPQRDALKVDVASNETPLKVSQFLMDVAKKTRKSSSRLGFNLVKIFGTKYKDSDGVTEVYKTIFSDENPGAQLALGNWKVEEKNLFAVQKLYGLTSDLLDYSTQTTRLFLLNALTTPKETQLLYLEQLRNVCAGKVIK